MVQDFMKKLADEEAVRVGVKKAMAIVVEAVRLVKKRVVVELTLDTAAVEAAVLSINVLDVQEPKRVGAMQMKALAGVPAAEEAVEEAALSTNVLDAQEPQRAGVVNS